MTYLFVYENNFIMILGFCGQCHSHFPSHSHQTAVLLMRGVDGNKIVFRISEYPVYYTLNNVPESI